jgi:TatD DNase family protein
MEFTDTHAHVFAEEFDLDQKACFQRNISENVTKVLVPNIDLGSILPLKKICSNYSENYFPMMGLHPCSVKEDYESVLIKIYDEFISTKYYGIGEIGMDLYWDKTTFEIQKRAFIEQANWAIKFNLPVSIHSRECTSELIQIIKDEKLNQLRGVFHCFSGNIEQAQTLMDMGFYLGIGGVVTFKNSGLAQVIQSIGPQKLVLETDSPYLAPTPHRGKRNETSYIPLIAQTVAQSLEISLKEIAEITTNNSKQVFGI